MRAVCVIPARGGSTRIPRKNIREFRGNPIIAYSIDTALKSRLFNHVWVSTDDDEIARIANQNGALVVRRSPELARDEVGTQEVMRQALFDITHENDLACCFYATAPLITVEDLWRARKALLDDRFDYAFSCGPNPLRDAGGFYFGRSIAFKSDVPLFDERTAMIPIPHERCIDINLESDWLRAERMYDALHRKAA